MICNINFYRSTSNPGLHLCCMIDTKLKADFQSVLRTLESLFTTFVLFHVRCHKM